MLKKFWKKQLLSDLTSTNVISDSLIQKTIPNALEYISTKE